MHHRHSACCKACLIAQHELQTFPAVLVSSACCESCLVAKSTVCACSVLLDLPEHHVGMACLLTAWAFTLHLMAADVAAASGDDLLHSLPGAAVADRPRLVQQ